MFFGGRGGWPAGVKMLPGALLSTPTVIWLSKYMSLMKATTLNMSGVAGRPTSAGFQGVHGFPNSSPAPVGLNGLRVKPGVVGPCAIARRFMIALKVASERLPRVVWS